MEISGSNALNRSMQGLWSNHRNKVNLNSPVTQLEATLEASSSLVEGLSQSVGASPIPSGIATNPPEDLKASTPGKRKTRSLRQSDGEENSKRVKRLPTNRSEVKDHASPSVRLSDLGGIESCIEKVLELVAMPLCHPEIYLHTGVQPPRGILLHGPPGCGKTLLANAIAGELEVPFISIAAPSIVSGMSGESEKTLRDTFDEAKRAAPCILFIDEIDAITPKRESAQREMERRIVAQFLTCMDEMSWERNENRAVVVIGATNRPDSLDPALRRAGRFDHEISMGVPDEEARAQILKVLSAKLRLDGNFDFRALAKLTPGYVGADLSALTSAAGIIAVKRIFQQLSDGSISLPDTDNSVGAEALPIIVESSSAMDLTPDLNEAKASSAAFSSLPASLKSNSIVHFLIAHPKPLTDVQLSPINITFQDFMLALGQVQPSSKREGFATVPGVTWADIGALQTVRDELHMAIVQPIKMPELFRRVGISAPSGVLLWGPPGCGKTLLAKAVSNESRANFISVKGPELLNKYVGESERAVRQVFTRARASAPCIIFFDELDALVPRRDDSSSESSARMVNTLLTELDGLESRKGVYVIAATNRPDMIDPAMCRPGRLDKLLYVDLPNADERAEIMRTLTREIPLRTESSMGALEDALDALVRSRCEGFSGADLAALVREAGVAALKRVLGSFENANDLMAPDELEVTVVDFTKALQKMAPSVSPAQRRRYEALRTKFHSFTLKIGLDNDNSEGNVTTS